MQDKIQLRRQFLRKRRSLPERVWREKSQLLAARMRSHPLFHQAPTILAYFSFRQEPDLSSLFTQEDKVWGFPRCVDRSLIWHRWQPGEALEKGVYGIFEPHRDAPTLQPEEVSLILVPGVACDRAGYRLGYGGGFYDRLLSLPEWSSKPTIGIIFDFAFVPHLPVEPWDRPLSAVCTEEQFWVNGKSKTLQ